MTRYFERHNTYTYILEVTNSYLIRPPARYEGIQKWCCKPSQLLMDGETIEPRRGLSTATSLMSIIPNGVLNSYPQTHG